MKRVALILTLMILATACNSVASVKWSVNELTNGHYDPETMLMHDWGPAIVIERGVANSCIERDSEVSGRRHLCRVIDGYEEIGDVKNWVIDYPANPVQMPLSVDGECNDGISWSDGGYGCVIVLQDGSTYEGCQHVTPLNDFICDYRARKHIVLKTSGDAYSYLLRKFWNWSLYTAGSPLACAGGLTGVMMGKSITAPMLADCADGPMDRSAEGVTLDDLRQSEPTIESLEGEPALTPSENPEPDSSVEGMPEVEEVGA